MLTERAIPNCDVAAVLASFEVIEDPRRKQAQRHPLMGILLMAFCTVAMGADSWEDMHDTALLHLAWYQTTLPNIRSVPSSDTFRRVLTSIQPEHLSNAFIDWLKRKALTHNSDRQVSFDGKALRGSKDGYTINAYDPDEHLFLAHTSVEENRNELSSFPKILQYLALEGNLCTFDAAYCFDSVMQLILNAKADYCVALKANQPTWQKAAEKLFSSRYPSTKSTSAVDKSRGYLETYRVWVSDKISEINAPGLRSAIKIETERVSEKDHSVQTRYYLSSRKASPEEFMRWIRNHWGIENGLHRTLDIHFQEDGCQIRNKIGAENISMFRKLAGSILHRLWPKKTLKSKMKALIASDDFRNQFINSDF
jgi:predicted transposase YbfD/YdcC